MSVSWWGITAVSYSVRQVRCLSVLSLASRTQKVRSNNRANQLVRGRANRANGEIIFLPFFFFFYLNCFQNVLPTVKKDLSTSVRPICAKLMLKPTILVSLPLSNKKKTEFANGLVEGAEYVLQDHTEGPQADHCPPSTNRQHHNGKE